MIFTDTDKEYIMNSLKVKEGMILHFISSSCPEYISYRGTVGEEIPFKDANGNILHIGDIVEVFDRTGRTNGLRRMIKLESDDRLCNELNLLYPKIQYPIYYPSSFLHEYIELMYIFDIIQPNNEIEFNVVLRKKYYDTYTIQEIDRIGFLNIIRKLEE